MVCSLFASDLTTKHTRIVVLLQASILLNQGFPILKNRTTTREDQLNSLFQMGIEVPSLPGYIANTQTIHQAENRTVEPGQQARNGSGACLARILPQSYISSPVEAIFDSPMIAHQFQHAWCSCLAQGEIAESIDHLVAHLPRVEEAGGAFESKDLLNALPLLAKPVIEIRATGDLSMLQAPMALRPTSPPAPTADDQGRDLQTDRQYRQQGSVGYPWQ
jgi:hypothetical protein